MKRAARRRVCVSCPNEIEQPASGRPRQYCSDACRQYAYAQRKRRRPVRSDWWTPLEVREDVLARWTVGLDAAATVQAALVENYLGPDHADPARRDALAFENWAGLLPVGQVVWLNPPYTPAPFLEGFLQRAVATAAAGVTVAGLVPASTGTDWWWRNIVEPGAEVEYLRGRLVYGGPHSTGGPAPWASALVTWRPTV